MPSHLRWVPEGASASLGAANSSQWWRARVLSSSGESTVANVFGWTLALK
jgi:hypothetical protein